MSARGHFRGVVWPRGTDGQKYPVYRYAVVGMLLTDQPLSFDGKKEVVLDGSSPGMAEVLETIRQAKPAIVLGDAADVLLNLNGLVAGPEDKEV